MKLLYILGIYLLLSNCSADLNVVETHLANGEHLIEFCEGSKRDTIFKSYSLIGVVDEKVSPKKIELIVESLEFYDYFNLIKEDQGWEIDDKNSGRFLSTSQSTNYILKITKDSIEIHSDGNIVFLPKSEIRLKPFLTHRKIDFGKPPLPPIEMFELTYQLRQDTLQRNREVRVDKFVNEMENACGIDSMQRIIRLTLNADGSIESYEVVKGIGQLEDDERFKKCIEKVLEKNQFDFGMTVGNKVSKKVEYNLSIGRK